MGRARPLRQPSQQAFLFHEFLQCTLDSCHVAVDVVGLAPAHAETAPLFTRYATETADDVIVSERNERGNPVTKSIAVVGDAVHGAEYMLWLHQPVFSDTHRIGVVRLVQLDQQVHTRQRPQCVFTREPVEVLNEAARSVLHLNVAEMAVSRRGVLLTFRREGLAYLEAKLLTIQLWVEHFGEKLFRISEESGLSTRCDQRGAGEQLWIS